MYNLKYLKYKSKYMLSKNLYGGGVIKIFINNEVLELNPEELSIENIRTKAKLSDQSKLYFGLELIDEYNQQQLSELINSKSSIYLTELSGLDLELIDAILKCKKVKIYTEIEVKLEKFKQENLEIPNKILFILLILYDKFIKSTFHGYDILNKYLFEDLLLVLLKNEIKDMINPEKLFELILSIIKSKMDALNKVKVNGLELEHLSDDLKKDYDIVINAVRNNGNALKFVIKAYFDPIRLREIVLQAVKNDGKALEYANEFFNDIEILQKAKLTTPNIFENKKLSKLLNLSDFPQEIKETLLIDVMIESKKTPRGRRYSRLTPHDKSDDKSDDSSDDKFDDF